MMCIFTINVTGKAIAVLIIGLVVRVAVTYLVVYGNNMTVKEKLFCTIAWLPKATVQVRIVKSHSEKLYTDDKTSFKYLSKHFY